MRILVISDLPQFVTGGAEMQAARLIEAWLDAGHQVICLGRRMGRGPVRIGEHAVEVHRIRTISVLGRWSRAASYFCSLAWLLFRHRNAVDIVYTRFLGDAALTVSVLKQVGLLRLPLVATPANVHGAGDAQFLRSIPFVAQTVRLLDSQCNAINLIADDMAGELQRMGFSGKNFSHIPNGIPIRPAHARNETPIPVFLAVGRLASQKAYDVLLQALASIKEQLRAKQIKIAGAGSEREQLAAMAAHLHVEDKVEWLGELTQEEVCKQLADANVFLLPSRYEGLSNAGLEAMERGLPIILTQCGGLDKYVDAQMGWVVPPGDAQALSHAIAMTLDTPADQLLAMGMRARQCVERHFDMAVTAQRYIDLFETLCKAKHKSAESPRHDRH